MTETPYNRFFQKAIRLARQEIEEEIFKLEGELEEVQGMCFHPVKDTKSITGNNAPDCVSYWKEHTCLDCGKHWRS